MLLEVVYFYELSYRIQDVAMQFPLLFLCQLIVKLIFSRSTSIGFCSWLRTCGLCCVILDWWVVGDLGLAVAGHLRVLSILTRLLLLGPYSFEHVLEVAEAVPFLSCMLALSHQLSFIIVKLSVGVVLQLSGRGSQIPGAHLDTYPLVRIPLTGTRYVRFTGGRLVWIVLKLAYCVAPMLLLLPSRVAVTIVVCSDTACTWQYKRARSVSLEKLFGFLFFFDNITQGFFLSSFLGLREFFV